MSRFTVISACAAIVAGLLSGGAGATTTTVSESFESDTVGAVPSNWTGYCYVTNQAGTYAKTDMPGYAITNVTHEKMLVVEGSAVREYTATESGNRVIDLMVKTDEWPDEELPTATGDEQIKFAFDTNGCVNLYHKRTSGGTAQWSKLSDTAIASDTWVRVTFTFDYTTVSSHPMCQLKIDGSAVTSSYGYRSPSDLQQPGSWYFTAIAGTAVGQVDFAGCGAVDDVVNAENSSDNPYTPAVPDDAPTATNGVDYAWLDEQGIAWSDLNSSAPGGSGYTVTEAFQTGVDPYGTNKLYVTNAVVSGENFTITINGYGRTYHMEKSASPFTDATAGTVVDGTFTSNKTDNTTTWTGPLPTDALTYYRVRATTASTAETVNQFAIRKYTASTANTLIALPWMALSPSATAPGSMTAANVLMNKNLEAGDWLLYYDSGYKGWRWNGSAWEALTTSSEVGGLTVAPAASSATLERGRAIWYVRTTADSRDLTQPFYLWGQYKTENGNVTVAQGGSLLASPDQTNAFTVSSSKITNATVGDTISVPGAGGSGLPKLFEYKDGSWGTDVLGTKAGPSGNMTTHTWTTSGDVMEIPAGTGFLYQTTNTTDTLPQVTW